MAKTALAKTEEMIKKTRIVENSKTKMLTGPNGQLEQSTPAHR